MLALDDVRQFFDSVIVGEDAVLQRIERGPENVWIEGQQFVFSIAALLALLEPEGGTSLKVFKNLLYSSKLNRELGALGAEIIVYQNTGKVDSNLYCLKTT